jgi:hypothetical protein
MQLCCCCGESPDDVVSTPISATCDDTPPAAPMPSLGPQLQVMPILPELSAVILVLVMTVNDNAVAGSCAGFPCYALRMRLRN